MKTTWRIIVVTGLLMWLNLATAQSDPLDAVNVSPDLYTVLFENEYVRVVEYKIAPGIQERWHTHPAKVAYIVEPGKLEITTANGSSFIADEERGAVRWLGRVGRHYGKNIGETTLHIVFVEVKGVDTPTDDLSGFVEDTGK